MSVLFWHCFAWSQCRPADNEISDDQGTPKQEVLTSVRKLGYWSFKYLTKRSIVFVQAAFSSWFQ